MSRRREDPSVPETFSNMKSSYNAAKQGRFRRVRTGLSPSGSGADYHYKNSSDYFRMMEYARDMRRNDGLGGRVVDTVVSNVMQGGFRLEPKTGNEGINSRILELWDEWANNPSKCDIAGKSNFRGMASMAFDNRIVDGDLLMLPLGSGHLQMIEGHRLKTPSYTTRNVVHGVLLNDNRLPLEYWVTKDEIDPCSVVNRVSDMNRYPAWLSDGSPGAFHVFSPTRPSQTRGVTEFAPIFDQIGMLDDINFAKLVQQQIVSCFAIIKKREMGGDYGQGSGSQYGAASTETRTDGSTSYTENVQPGMEVTGLPGEDISMASPNVPDAGYFEHAKFIASIICVNLGVPYMVAMLDASETNFSGWRGAFDQAKINFRIQQQTLSEQVHEKVYRWKIAEWFRNGQIVTPRNDFSHLFLHKWHFPVWPYIEPFKDAKADELRLAAGLTSPRRLHGERGQDWEEISKEIPADNAAIIKNCMLEARKIMVAFPEFDVDWREFRTFAVTPSNKNMVVGEEDSEGDGEEPKKPADKKEPLND